MKKSLFWVFSMLLCTTQLTGCLESEKGCSSDNQCHGERVCMDGLCGEATPNNRENNGEENNDNNLLNNDNNIQNNGFNSGFNNGFLNNDNNANNANNDNNDNNIVIECKEGGGQCPDDLVCSGEEGVGTCQTPDRGCRALIDGGGLECDVDYVCENEVFYGSCQTFEDGNRECFCAGDDFEVVFQSDAVCEHNSLAEAFNTHCGSRIPLD